eukprot:14657033-Heterocapsa_arctica.AAC.1
MGRRDGHHGRVLGQLGAIPHAIHRAVLLYRGLLDGHQGCVFAGAPLLVRPAGQHVCTHVRVRRDDHLLVGATRAVDLCAV